MRVLAPYTSSEEVSEITGVDVPARRLHRLDRRDDIVVVLYQRDGKLLGSTPVRREVADLLPLTEVGLLDRSVSVVADLRDPQSPAPEVVLRRV